MASEYAVLGPDPAATTTGPHQVGVGFSGHHRLVRQIDGRTERYDAEPGAVYVTGPSPITWLEVTEPTEALEIYPDLALVGRLADGAAEVRPSYAVSDGVVFAVASRLRRAHMSAAALTDVEASTLAHLLVRHLLRRYGTSSEPHRRPPGELRPGAVDIVAEYTHAHLADEITLDALAGAVNLSAYHFARSFRATTGMSPHAFVTEHRLMVARDRLLRGDGSVTGIALSVGFSNISHFRRLFRRHYGLAPADLRRASAGHPRGVGRTLSGYTRGELIPRSSLEPDGLRRGWARGEDGALRGLTGGQDPMAEIVRAGLIQQRWTGDKDSMIAAAVNHIQAAASDGAQVVCLQELFYGPYFCQVQDADYYSYTEAIPDGPTTRLLQDAARQHGIVIIAPMYEEEHPGVYYNTAAVIDADGSYLGKYRKTHLPQVKGFWEKFYFRPGNLGYPVFDTAVGRIGVYICYDRHFPEGWRALGLAGARIVFNPSATSRGLSQYLWRLEQPAAAVANEYFVGAINRVGVEPLGDNDFYGQTYFADPRGQLIGDAAADDKDEVLVRDLDMEQLAEVRNLWQFYRDRRPDQYDSLVQP